MLCMERKDRAKESVGLYTHGGLLLLLCYALIEQSLADVKSSSDQSQAT